MIKKQGLLVVAFVFLLAVPAQASLNFNWETNASYTSVDDSEFLWDTGLQANGNLALGQNWALYLRGKSFFSSDDDDGDGTLDRLYLQYQNNSYRIKVGRQAAIWGVGWLFRPTDLLTPMQRYKEDETRPGKDLITLYHATSPLTALELVAGENIAAVRSEWRVGETNLRALGMLLPEGIKTVGFDFQGGLAGFYSEACYQWSERFEDGKLAIMLGWKKVVFNNNILFMEYYRNESLSAGQSYLGGGIQIPWDELTSYDIIAVYNLDHQDIAITGIANWQISDSMDLKASVSIASGSQVTLRIQSNVYF